MKKHVFTLTMAASATLLFSACSSPEKMVDAASQVQAKCEPAILEARADVIDARYALTFPAKYFHPKGILELTPVLVYEGGEESGAAKWLQGESVSDNYTVIPQTGGNVTQTVQFNYKEGMQVSHLELRVKLHYKNKAIAFPVAYKLADGTNITYKLAELTGVPVIAADSYQKVFTETREAQIKYIINSSVVRPAELSKSDIKALESFLSDAEKDAKKQAKGTEIIAYASPDGPLDLNTNLSSSRGKTAKEALAKTTKKLKQQGQVNLSSIAEDWDGFRNLVLESNNVPDKELILRVLSMYSDPIVREREIKNMSKVYQILADKVLPELRRARLVASVEVNNYSDSELLAFVKDNNMEVLDIEALLYAATLVSDNATKISVYNKAAQKFNDWRAYNNLAYVYLVENKTAEAKNSLGKISETNDIVKNNKGVVALREGQKDEAAKLFASATTVPQSRENNGVLDIIKGSYTDAVSKLSNSGSFNEALANVLVQDYSKASNILKNLTSAKAHYLKAIIAARSGNTSHVASELNNAYAKDATLKAYAHKDIEFAKVKGSI